MFKLHTRKVVSQVHWFDGPTWSGGAGLTVYQYDDGSLRTVESDWHGREIVAYEGEPREVSSNASMPDPPPVAKPGQKAYDLGPVPLPPPWPPPKDRLKGDSSIYAGKVTGPRDQT